MYISAQTVNDKLNEYYVREAQCEKCDRQEICALWGDCLSELSWKQIEELVIDNELNIEL